jgi:hypothetical protein
MLLRIVNSGLLRAQLDLLRARYDHGATSGSIYKIIKELEREIAWLEQRQPPKDPSFIQQAWPVKLKRKPPR